MDHDGTAEHGDNPIAPPAGALTFRDWRFSVDQEKILHDRCQQA